MENELKEELKGFIRQYITSLEELEVLLIMFKEPERFWTAEEIFAITQSNVVSIGRRLKYLSESGFLKESDGPRPKYQFCPNSPELAQRIAELKDAYAISKYKIFDAIFSVPRGQAKLFADSFKLKRKE
jgi:hypothetical protein